MSKRQLKRDTAGIGGVTRTLIDRHSGWGAIFGVFKVGARLIWELSEFWNQSSTQNSEPGTKKPFILLWKLWKSTLLTENKMFKRPHLQIPPIQNSNSRKNSNFDLDPPLLSPLGGPIGILRVGDSTSMLFSRVTYTRVLAEEWNRTKSDSQDLLLGSLQSQN